MLYRIILQYASYLPSPFVSVAFPVVELVGDYFLESVREFWLIELDDDDGQCHISVAP